MERHQQRQSLRGRNSQRGWNSATGEFRTGAPQGRLWFSETLRSFKESVGGRSRRHLRPSYRSSDPGLDQREAFSFHPPFPHHQRCEGKLRSLGVSQGEAAPGPQRCFFSLGFQTLRLGSQLRSWSPLESPELCCASPLGPAEPPLWIGVWVGFNSCPKYICRSPFLLRAL